MVIYVLEDFGESNDMVEAKMFQNKGIVLYVMSCTFFGDVMHVLYVIDKPKLFFQ